MRCPAVLRSWRSQSAIADTSRERSPHGSFGSRLRRTRPKVAEATREHVVVDDGATVTTLPCAGPRADDSAGTRLQGCNKPPHVTRPDLDHVACHIVTLGSRISQFAAIGEHTAFQYQPGQATLAIIRHDAQPKYFFARERSEQQ